MGSIGTVMQANNFTRIARGAYDAKVMLQQSGNKKEAARLTLAEFSRSMANQLKQEGAGKEYNEAVGQLAATLEGRTVNRLNSSLAASERLGQIAAQAGAMGVGGSSVDLLSDTIKLQRNIEQDLQQLTTDRTAAQGQRQAAQIMDNAYSQTDLTRTFGSFNYETYIEPKAMKRRFGKMIGIAAATIFGGPEAGAAVSDAAVGTWQASNADYNGMQKSIDSSIQNAVKGYQTWASLQDPNKEGMETWFGAVTKKGKKDTTGSSTDQAINWGGFKPGEESTYGSGFGSSWGSWLGI